LSIFRSFAFRKCRHWLPGNRGYDGDHAWSSLIVWHVRGVLVPDDEASDLYIVDGRITFDRLRGAETIVDRGWIVPGLVDAHCHIGLRASGTAVRDSDEAKALAMIDRATGVLALRDAGSPLPYPALDEDPDMPRLVRAGRHVAPPGRYVPGVAAESSAVDLPLAVKTQAGAGNGWVKLVGDYFADEAGGIAPNWHLDAVRAAIDQAHALNARVAAHTLGPAGATAMVEAGVDSIEHGLGLAESLIDEMARRQTALVPTVLAVDTLRYVAVLAEPEYPAYSAYLRWAGERFPAVVRAAHEAGVPVFVGTDAGTEVAHGRIVDEMLALRERVGLPAADILAAASWRARDWLRLGGVEEGGPADLIVYPEDPRRNLAILRAPSRVVLRGVPLP
jgi:imidazolonepropionase-like amidohydrolase